MPLSYINCKTENFLNTNVDTTRYTAVLRNSVIWFTTKLPHMSASTNWCQPASCHTISVDLKRDVRSQQTVVTNLWELLGPVGIGRVQLQDPLLDTALDHLGDVRLVLPLRIKLVDIFHTDMDVVPGQHTAHVTDSKPVCKCICIEQNIKKSQCSAISRPSINVLSDVA